MMRNPNSSSSLTLEELRPGMRYVVIEGEDYTETGKILCAPTYGEEGWFGALAQIDGYEEPKPFDVYAAGVICAPDGRWPDVFTIGEADDRL